MQALLNNNKSRKFIYNKNKPCICFGLYLKKSDKCENSIIAFCLQYE